MRGALLFVDAYQTLGTMPIDVRALGVDFLAAGNLKFLMGIPGIAFLYVRRSSLARSCRRSPGGSDERTRSRSTSKRSTGRRRRAASTLARRR